MKKAVAAVLTLSLFFLAACGGGGDKIKVDGATFTVSGYSTNNLMVPVHIPEGHFPFTVTFAYEANGDSIDESWDTFYRWMYVETSDGTRCKPIEDSANPDHQTYTVWFTAPEGNKLSEALVVFEEQKMPLSSTAS